MKYRDFVNECMKDFSHDNDHITLMYLASGFVEEAKELTDKLRYCGGVEEIVSEAGDILWYITAIKIKFGHIDGDNLVVGGNKNVIDMSINLLVQIKRMVFFNSETTASILSILSESESVLMSQLKRYGCDVGIATIQQTNSLKLRKRYDRTRETLYINKNVEEEDSIILKQLNKQHNEKNTIKGGRRGQLKIIF